jgi:hypothetical protein
MNSTVTSRGGWSRWLIIAACVPLVGFVIGAVLLAALEYKAASQLQAKVNQLKQAGRPFDNASFERWYKEHTRPEGAGEWVQVLDAVSATSQLGAVDDLPIVGNGKELAELDPKTVWADEPRVKEYLTEMQGLIQRAHQLSAWPTPVQLPIDFNGWQTLLPHFQQARSLLRLLQLDFEYAFYHGEFDRAQQDLAMMGTLANAIDNDLFLVVDLIAAATKQSLYNEIQRSVLTDNWPTEKLSELRQMVSRVRYSPEKWRKLFTCERAMIGDHVALGDLSLVTGQVESSFVPLLNTGRLRIFDAFDELIAVANADFSDLKSASKTAAERVLKRTAAMDVDGANMWIALTFPAAEQMARAFENEESNRRLTLTAIGLRQFQRQEGRWPSGLSELTKMGLTASDYSTVNRGAFGYEVTEEAAYVWGSDVSSNDPVKASRPSVDADSQANYMTTIKLR